MKFNILLLYLTYTYLTTGESLYHTFWVTPSTEQGCGNRTPCNTIEGYYNQSKSIFSTSNATWIFLEGIHLIPGKYSTVISSIKNVRFSGISTQATTLLINDLKISYSVNITIEKLTIKNGFNEKKLLNTVLTVENIINLTLFQVEMVKKLRTDSVVSFHIQNCSLKRNLVVDCYLSQFNSIFLQFHGLNRSVIDISLTLNDVVIQGIDMYVFYSSEDINDARFHLQIDNTTVINSLFFIDIYSTNSFQISIKNCQFISCVFMNEFSDRKSLNKGSDSHFKLEMFVIDTLFRDTPIVSEAKTTLQDPLLQFLRCTFTGYHPRKVKTPKLSNLYLDYVLNFENFQSPAVVLSDCSIVYNYAGAINLQNCKLHLQRLNLIEGNHILEPTNPDDSNLVGGMLCIQPSSSILLGNNSNLIIRNNLDYRNGALFLPPFNGPQCSTGNNPFLRECKGNCFVQLVKENGQYISAADIRHFNASVAIHNNKARMDVWCPPETPYPSNPNPKGNQIFNGHLYNCTLKTADGGSLSTNLTILKRFIHLPSWSRSEVSSPPYYICLCAGKNWTERNMWDCNESSSLTYLAGETPSLFVAVLEDMGVLLQGNLSINYKLSAKTTSAILNTTRCVEIPLDTQLLVKNDLLVLYFKVTRTRNICNPYSPPDTYFLWHSINIKTIHCPIGLEGNTTSQSCDCVPFLKHHNFQCFSMNSKVFKQNNKHYWMALQNNRLVFSKYCLPIFCNNILKEQGVSLRDINSTLSVQCSKTNSRVGFLCSECPKGYSSGFGDYACIQCDGPWFILAVPVYALVGLVLIALLFLFNLTVVEGTISGVSFYANIMYLFGDFMQDKLISVYLAKIILALNFGPTFVSCFSNEMDEFVRFLLNFIFSYYLLLLVFFIILGAHKFNLRIFRVEFIAKRAVPVLATLIVITYANLILLVINVLRNTSIYTYDPNTLIEPYKVWLFQPTLRYFSGRHLVLGMLAMIVTLLYLIPLTVVILFGDLLRRNCIRSLWFSHFLDVFHGAYRWPLGFWLGLRLMIVIFLSALRIMLPNHIYISVFVLILILFFIETIAVKPYHKRFYSRKVQAYNKNKEKKKLKNRIIASLLWFSNPTITDKIFLLNILFFAAITGFNSRHKNELLTACSVISILGAVLQICLIVISHGWKYFPIPKCTLEMCSKLKRMSSRRRRHTGSSRSTGTRVQNKQEQEFPFHHIHSLEAGLPQENESSEEDDTPFSSTEDEDCAEERFKSLAEPLLLAETIMATRDSS